ncbi:MAG: ADP-ribosylation factor-like protein [Promethearchaeota archaeon]
MGPKILFKAPEDFNEVKLNFLPTLMDLDEDEMDLFEFEHQEFNTANIRFNLKSKEARGGVDMFMISLILYKEEIEPQNFKDALYCFIEDFGNIHDVTLGVNPRREDFSEEKFEEIKNFFYSFHSDLPEETILFDKNIKILVIGCPNAGKTTFINSLRDNIYSFKRFKRNITAKRLFFNNLRMTTYDLPRKKEFGKIWIHYLHTRDGFIFTIDVSDSIKFPEINRELHKISEFAQKDGKPLLILLNKIDIIERSIEEILDELGILNLPTKKVKYFPVSVTKKDGIFEAFDWIANKILKNILLDANW